MRLTQMSDDELIQKKMDLAQELKSLPTYSLHRRDIIKALDRIDRERLRRALVKEKENK